MWKDATFVSLFYYVTMSLNSQHLTEERCITLVYATRLYIKRETEGERYGIIRSIGSNHSDLRLSSCNTDQI